MTPQTLTVISGIVLLLVFALVGWRVRRRHDADVTGDRPRPGPRDP